MDVRFAAPADAGAIGQYDRHITPDRLRSAIGQGRVLLAEREGRFLGWLRYGLFWDNTPFMNMLFVLDGCRGDGVGKALVAFWEREMGKQGFGLLMTSTSQSEDAQHFYRRLGYHDAGSFRLPGEPPERILIKVLEERE